MLADIAVCGRPWALFFIMVELVEFKPIIDFKLMVNVDQVISYVWQIEWRG